MSGTPGVLSRSYIRIAAPGKATHNRALYELIKSVYFLIRMYYNILTVE